MALVNTLTNQDVQRLVDWLYGGGAPLYLRGKAAEDMGLNGEANPAMAVRVLRDGIGPNGKPLATIVAESCEQADALTYRAPAIVSYSLRLCPHETVDEVNTEHFWAVPEAANG